PAIPVVEGQAAWRWTRGYVENVAAAVAHAAADDRAAGQVYNVGEADALTEAEWIATIGCACDWHGETVPVPRALLPNLAPDFDWCYHLVTDTRRFRDQLRFVEPIPRSEALRRTVEWERMHIPEASQSALDYAAEDAAMGARSRQSRARSVAE